jgi:hypothetical protein
LPKYSISAHATYQVVNSIENLVGGNEKPIRIEILEPDVKEILSTCALYNLDQVRLRTKKFDPFSFQELFFLSLKR